MKRKISSFVLLLCLTSLTNAQNNNLSDFDFLKSEGTIPSEFITLSTVKFQQQLLEAKNAKANKHVDKHTEEFLLFSNYMLDELLLSGKVLFNDPVTQYVNKVAATLLKNEPDLLNELRFYTVRSTDPNAFATHQGMIFVTIGLLAELETEAQLAFVLSHEIVHYQNKHVISGYVEQQKVLNGEGKSRYNTTDEKIRHVSNYSQELELEADSIGFIRFSKSGYNMAASSEVMDVLQFAGLPFYEKPFDHTYFEKASLKIPHAYILDSVKKIDFSLHLEDDKYSSHPNLNKRSTRLTGYMNGAPPSKDKNFIDAESDFKNARTLARLEDIRLLIIERQYPEAVFEATSMLKYEFGDNNKFLEKIVIKALYGIAKYKMHGNYGDCASHYGEVEGEMQQCVYFFYKLTQDDAMALACRKLMDFTEKYKDDAFSKELKDDLFEDFVERLDFKIEKVTKELEIQKRLEQEKMKVDTVVETKTDTTTSDKSKIEILRKLREEEARKKKEREKDKVLPEKNFYLLFADVASDPNFAQYLKKIREDIDAKKQAETVAASKEKKPFIRAGNSAAKQRAKKSGNLPENLDKIVFVDPFFVSLDKDEDIKFQESEKKLINLENIISYSCQKTGMAYDFIAPKSFGANDVDKYNHLARLNDWMDEALDHDDMSIIPLQAENVSELAKVYGTTHFAYTGVLHFIAPKENVGSMLLYGILFYPVLPYVMVKLFTPSHRTVLYTMIINLEKGKAEYDDFKLIEASDNLHMVSSIVYDQINQMTIKK